MPNRYIDEPREVSTVDIEGFEYTVRLCKDILIGNEVCRGLADYWNQRIEIDRIQPYETRCAILLHEALHVICDTYEVEMAEKDMRIVSQGLYKFMNQNGHVFNDIDTDESLEDKEINDDGEVDE